MVCVTDLEPGIEAYRRLGFNIQPGGVHTGRGTHNAIAFFEEDYLEVMGVRDRQEYLSSARSEEHTSEFQSQFHLVCRLLLEKKKEAAGLNAVAEGFRHLGFKDDHEINAAEWIVYDALYAYCQEMTRRDKPDGAFRSSDMMLY